MCVLYSWIHSLSSSSSSTSDFCIQVVGIILAFKTRKVEITALICIFSITLVVIVLITFILRSYINLSAAVFSGGIIILATFFLGLSFIPKVLIGVSATIFRNPQKQRCRDWAAEDCYMLLLFLTVPSCIYSFWHGVIPTSYFIFNDFYTCFTIFFSQA